MIKSDIISNLVTTFYNGIVYKIRYMTKINKSANVLIVFSGLLGDSILAFNMMQQIVSNYRQHNKNVYVIARDYVNNAFRICGLSGAELIDVDLKKYCIDRQYFKEINAGILSNSFEIAIFPQQSTTSLFMTFNIKAHEKIALLDRTQKRYRMFKSLLERMGYNKRYYVADFYNMLPRFQKLSNLICGKKRTTVTPYIAFDTIVQTSHIIEGRYVIFTPYASDDFRCWEIDKFIELAELVIHHGYKIVFSVTKAKDDLISMVGSLPKTEVYVIQGTSLEELFCLIKNADLLVGVDSAPIHIASALGTQAICIQIGRDDELLYPYKAVSTAGTKYPICIQTEKKECFGCHIRYGIEGYGNQSCMKQKKTGKKALCVEEITVAQVYYRIKGLIGKGI